jgi:DNA polymerase III delta prime subunit
MLKSQEKYNNFRRNKIKELGIDELEKKLKLLNEKLKEDSKIERKFLKLDEIEKNTNDTKSKLNITVEKNKKTVQSVLEKYPSHIQKQVISELDKEKKLEKNKNKLPVEDNSLSM